MSLCVSLHACVLYLEQVFGDDREALAMVTDILEVGVLIQDSVVDVQEEVKRILVQEMDLKKDIQSHVYPCSQKVLQTFSDCSIIKYTVLHPV